MKILVRCPGITKVQDKPNKVRLVSESINYTKGVFIAEIYDEYDSSEFDKVVTLVTDRQSVNLAYDMILLDTSLEHLLNQLYELAQQIS